MARTYIRKPKFFTVLKVSIIFLLIIVSSACATKAATTFSPIQSHPSSTKMQPTNPPLILTPEDANTDIKAGNLLIQSSSGIECPNRFTDISNVQPFANPANQVVLASNRLTYTRTEIAQILSFIHYYDTGKEPVKLPSTLREISGGVTNPTNFFPLGSDCGIALVLTNTGNTPIQIPKVAARVTVHPQRNTYQYRLIDTCSLNIYDCPLAGSGGNDCSMYAAAIQLGLEEENGSFSAVPSGPDASCGTLTIAPATQIYLGLTFFPAANIPQNLIYSVSPTFTIVTAQGEQTILLPQLISTLTFASEKQFSCYGLEGTHFVLIPSPEAGANNCV